MSEPTPYNLTAQVTLHTVGSDDIETEAEMTRIGDWIVCPRFHWTRRTKWGATMVRSRWWKRRRPVARITNSWSETFTGMTVQAENMQAFVPFGQDVTVTSGDLKVSGLYLDCSDPSNAKVHLR